MKDECRKILAKFCVFVEEIENIKGPDKFRNEGVLRRDEEKREILKTIKNKKRSFFTLFHYRQDLEC